MKKRNRIRQRGRKKDESLQYRKSKTKVSRKTRALRKFRIKRTLDNLKIGLQSALARKEKV